MAHPSDTQDSGLQVLTLCVDSLNITHKITLIKIDAEGHEAGVLRGMHRILLRDKPTLIVETGSREIEDSLERIGYTHERLDGSPNVLFLAKASK